MAFAEQDGIHPSDGERDEADAGAERDETLYVMDSILYRASGRPVMPSQDEDAAYCNAYRRLFGRLGYWPPDGVYSFDGEEMTLEHVVPWARLLAQVGVM